MKKILGIVVLVLAGFFLILFFKVKANRQTASLIEPKQIKKMIKKTAPKREIKFLEEKIPPHREIIEPSEDLPSVRHKEQHEEQNDKVSLPEQKKIKEIRLKDISQEPSISDVSPDVSPKKKTPSKEELEEMGRRGIIIY